MGYDISYHPIDAQDIQTRYFEVLAQPERLGTLCQDAQIDAFYQDKYQQIIDIAKQASSEQFFDNTHGYYIANIQGLFAPYYYVRGGAFTFLMEIYPHYQQYTQPWSVLLEQTINRPELITHQHIPKQRIENRISQNYSSGVYLSPDAVVQLLADYENDNMIRSELETYFSHGRFTVFLKALQAAKTAQKGLLEATEVIEPNPFQLDQSQCYSDLNHVDPEGLALYAQAAHEQLDQVQDNKPEKNTTQANALEQHYQHYMSQMLEADSEQLSEIEPQLKSLLEEYPNQGKIHFALGWLNTLYDTAQSYQRSLDYFQQAVDQGYRHFYLDHLIGTAYQALGENAEAISAYQHSLMLYPYFELNHVRIGDIYEQAQDWQNAKSAYESAIQCNAGRAEYFNNLGVYCGKLGLEDQEIAHYQRALVMSPHYYDAYKNLSWALYAQQDYVQSQQIATQALAQTTDHIAQYHDVFYDVLGRSAVKLGETAQAVDYFQQGIAKYPQYGANYFELASIYDHQNQSEKALEFFNNYLTLKPSDGFAYYKRGKLYSRAEQYELAEADFLQAIAHHDQSANTYTSLGYVYDALKQPEKAVEAYQQAVQLEPDYAMAHANMAISYWDLGQHDLALQKLKDTLAIQPDYQSALFNHAIYLQKLNRVDEAIAAYLTLITHYPQHKLAHLNVAYLYYDRQQWQQAIDHFQVVLNLEPNHYHAITHIASSYYRLANDEQAKIYYSQAIQLKPDTAQHYYNRGLCYQNLNETQLAIADFETVLKLDPNHEKAKAALAKLKPAKKSWFW